MRENRSVDYCQGANHCADSTHLCRIVARSKDMDKVRKLVKDASYICRKCGRVARNNLNLCKPSKI